MNKKIIGMLICILLLNNFLVIIDAQEETLAKEKIVSINFSEPVIQKQDKYITISLEEATSSIMEPGKPVLPVFSKTYVLPFGTTIKAIECKPLQTGEKVLSNKIQPSQTPVLLKGVENNIVEDFQIEESTIYNSIDFFPNNWFSYRIGCGLEDSCHVVFLTIQFYPIRYSPGQNIIKHAELVDIKIEYSEPATPVEFQDEYDMVIITPSEFSEELQPLADYKNDCDVITKIVTLDEIYDGVYFPIQGRDEQEQIKYFIKNAIEQWGITYVLLAGGANKIPVRMSYLPDGYEDYIISDLYYADVYDQYGNFCSWDSNNNDIFGEYNIDIVDTYPDVYLGRLNFRALGEVSDVINKIITYESTGAYMENWFPNFVVCGGDSFNDYANVDEGEYLNQNAISIMYDFLPNKIWASNGRLQFAVNIDYALENGTGFLYMTGHGTHETWATHPHGDFQTWWPIGSYFYLRAEVLTNGGKLPIIIIGGCSNLEFSTDNCFGWSFVKNPSGGGIASYGNSALGWGYTGYGCTQGLTGAMELSAFKAYKNQNAKTTGELWVKALNNYISQIGLWSSFDYKTVEEWEPFNDPSMRITKVSDKPDKPDPPSGPTSGDVRVEYNYTTLTSDPDGDQLKYCFDWGDKTFSWTERLESGQIATISHKWDKPGNYEVKVKARDIYGLESEWSEPLLVNIVSNAPFIDIVRISGGITRVKTLIKNIGLNESFNVTCNISVVGGTLGFINVNGGETFEKIGVEEKKSVRVSKVLGFGKINVTVSVSDEYSIIATKSADGLAMGAVILVFR